MHQRLLKTCSLLLLLMYGMYTLSPSYAVRPGPAAVGGPEEASSGGVQVGILWVSVVLESLTGDARRGDISRGEAVTAASRDEDLLLVRKKRAVHNRSFRVQPPPEALIGMSDCEEPSPALSSHEIPRDLIHGHADGCYSVSTGLSPPPSLS